jgi:hypothetical protein
MQTDILIPFIAYINQGQYFTLYSRAEDGIILQVDNNSAGAPVRPGSVKHKNGEVWHLTREGFLMSVLRGEDGQPLVLDYSDATHSLQLAIKSDIAQQKWEFTATGNIIYRRKNQALRYTNGSLVLQHLYGMYEPSQQWKPIEVQVPG